VVACHCCSQGWVVVVDSGHHRLLPEVEATGAVDGGDAVQGEQIAKFCTGDVASTTDGGDVLHAEVDEVGVVEHGDLHDFVWDEGRPGDSTFRHNAIVGLEESDQVKKF